MLGIGLGIDYGLLMVNRFREERGQGLDVHDAVVATIASAGTTVVFSALTVAVAMSGLFVFGVPLLTSFGIAGLAVVLLSMLAAITLLPATLAVVGRTDQAQRPGTRHARAASTDSPAGCSGARSPSPVRSAIVLLLLGAPFLERSLRERRRPHPAPLVRGARRRRSRWPTGSPPAAPTRSP